MALATFMKPAMLAQLHVVDVAVGLCAVFDTLFVDVTHDCVEFVVDFFGAPLQVHGVLAHFKSRGCYAAGVDSLAGSIDDAARDEGVDSLGCAAHVRDFADIFDTVVDELMSVFAVEFVLCGAGKSDVDFLFPGFAACIECRAGEFVGIGSDDVVARCTEFEHIVDLLGIETCGVIDITVGSRDGDDFGAEFGSLEGGTATQRCRSPRLRWSCL